MLRATFPAGTVSGAPKVRAMEIIDELEPTKRGIYSGAVGYISFQDDMDTAIALRTAVLKDGTLYAQAGGGIVHDSSPEGEWQETLNKLRAVLRAAEMVQQGLDEGSDDPDAHSFAAPRGAHAFERPAGMIMLSCSTTTTASPTTSSST